MGSISDRAEKVLREERECVAARVAALQQKSEDLHKRSRTVDAELREAASSLKQLDEVLGISAQSSIDDLTVELRGRRLREVAIEILARSKGAGVPIHYKEWFELLMDQGLVVGGKDPRATFLTQISTAPEVESVRPRSGLYRLKDAA